MSYVKHKTRCGLQFYENKNNQDDSCRWNYKHTTNLKKVNIGFRSLKKQMEDKQLFEIFFKSVVRKIKYVIRI